MRRKFTTLGTLSLFFLGGFAMAQVTGVLKDSSGFALDDAEVKVESTGQTAYTDMDGNFSIDAKVGDTLTIVDASGEVYSLKVTKNSLGEVKFAKTKTDEIELQSVNILGGIKLDPAAKVGSYGIVTREAFENTPVASIDEVLNGRVAGLTFGTASGDPGASNMITIRGVGSVLGTPNPLYVIDGVVVGKGSDNASVMESWNPLSSIDPNMVENIVVLKDASATALYGARGANGVIVITTKKGKFNSTPRFSFSTDMAVQDIAFDKVKPMSAGQYHDYGAQLYYNSQATLGNTFENLAAARTAFIDAMGDSDWDGTEYDWRKQIRRNQSTVATYNFSTSGGGENISYRAGLTYYKNKPLVQETNFDRISANLALDQKINDKLRYGFNLNYTKVNRQSIPDANASANPWLSSLFIPKTKPFYDADGNLNQTNLGEVGNDFNPIGIINNNYVRGKISTYLGSANVDWNIFKNVYFNALIGGQYQMQDEVNWWHPLYGDGITYNGYLLNASTKVGDWNSTNTLAYRNTFNNIHNIDFSIGTDYQEHEYRREYEQIQNFEEIYEPYIQYGDMETYVNSKKAAGNYYKWTQYSYFSRLNYIYDNKYTLSGQFRYDANSTLPEDNKGGWFWSAGASWNIAKESFLQSNSTISTLVLKGSYGRLGNIPFADMWGYQYLSYSLLSTSVSNPYGGDPYTSISQAGNPALRWEISKQLDLGFEVGFFNDRLKFEFDYYDKRTDGAFFTTTTQSESGSPGSYISNAIDLTNKGVELVVNAIPVQSSDFNWIINGNMAYNENKVVEMYVDQDRLGDPNGLNGMVYLEKGYLLGEYYTYLWAGVDQETGQGSWWKDGSKTERVYSRDDAEMVHLGKSAFPKYTAALTNQFNYKGLSLSVLFTGKFDYLVQNGYHSFMIHDGMFPGRNQITDALDYWTENNRDARNPKPELNNPNSSRLESTRWLYKGDHIRLKEVKLAYSFGDAFKSQTGVKNLTVYVKGFNLWTYAFDKNLNFDPESMQNAWSWAGAGVFNYTTPVLRSVSLGVQIDL